jgi:hypothetical protein
MEPWPSRARHAIGEAGRGCARSGSVASLVVLPTGRALRDEPTNRVNWWSANSPCREVFGWAGRITGPWWALGILVLTPMITLVTLTLGRVGQVTRASEDGAAASVPAVSARTAEQARKDRQWTSA